MDLTLNRDQVRELLTFCRRHGLPHFCVVRDEDVGVLVGASAIDAYCVNYFPGCDPNKYPDWHAVMVENFGPDEFIHYLPLAYLDLFLRALSGRATGLRVSTSPDAARIETIYGGEHAPQL
jgi:hypothetical protein